MSGTVEKTSTLPEGVLDQNDDSQCANSQQGESNEDDNNEFYFESDHVALKNNTDYRNLLKTLAILEAQRYRALKDIDTIVSLKKKLNDDPVKFVECIMNGSLTVPGPQNIPSLPQIDWSKYKIPLSEVNKSVPSVSVQETPETDFSKSKFLVRGRLYDESKPETFNQLWTVEEQQRLEELLLKYPPEEIETNRWRKIAADLGNRTAKQVCSRVQKYFLKLHKAGLPVPGRAPKAHAQAEAGKKSSHPYQRRLLRPTTFFPHQEVPVNLTDPDESDIHIASAFDSSCHSHLQITEELESLVEEESNEENIAQNKIKNIMNNRKLELMKKVLEVKKGEQFEVSHVGFKCDNCGEDPITGVRWICEVCPTVDFCTDCVIAQLSSTTPHPLSHNIVPFKERKDKDIYDKDYFPVSFSEPGCSYNYLDPNFLPGAGN